MFMCLHSHFFLSLLCLNEWITKDLHVPAFQKSFSSDELQMFWKKLHKIAVWEQKNSTKTRANQVDPVWDRMRTIISPWWSDLYFVLSMSANPNLEMTVFLNQQATLLFKGTDETYCSKTIYYITQPNECIKDYIDVYSMNCTPVESGTS